MPRFCANISRLFAELPFIERIGAARAAGFEAVEILFPYDGDATALKEALAVHELSLALINCPPPNYADPRGPRGFAAVPEEAARFRSAFRRSKRYAEALGAERIHIMAGRADGPQARQVFIDNLSWAVSEAPDLMLTIEPQNSCDAPGYFLNDFGTATSIIDEVGAGSVRLQFDLYHAQRIAGDWRAAWDSTREYVGHVQFADVPGRGAPGTGQLDVKSFFACLDADGYRGWTAAEYDPGPDTRKTLAWLKEARS